MSEFAKDIQNLIVKHWGKLILVGIIIGFMSNYNDVKSGFNNGWNNVRHNQTK